MAWIVARSCSARTQLQCLQLQVRLNGWSGWIIACRQDSNSHFATSTTQLRLIRMPLIFPAISKPLRDEIRTCCLVIPTALTQAGQTSFVSRMEESALTFRFLQLR